MPILAKKAPSYPVCPGGSHIGVCIDVVDMGMVKSNYNGKPKTQHKIRIVWQTGETQENGKPFHVSKRYTLSLHEKSSLRKDLESWRGRAFTESELEGWDVEGVLGAGAMLSVVQVAQNGNVYANVTAIMRPPKGMALPMIDTTYVRVQDRKTEDEAPGDGPPEHEEWVPTDDDVPF
jgi:hypothetical protein